MDMGVDSGQQVLPGSGTSKTVNYATAIRFAVADTQVASE